MMIIMKLINKINLFSGENSKKKQAMTIEYLKYKHIEEYDKENCIRNNCNLLVTAVSILTTVFMQMVYKLLEVFPNNTKFL